MDLVVLLGDLVACYGTDHEYATVVRFLDKVNQPYYAINGNHEFFFELHDEASGNYGRVWKEQSIEQKRAQLDKFRGFFELPELWHVQQNRFGTFIFLGLDDVANYKQEALSPRQQAWFAEQLRQTADTPVFVFCHAPLMLDQRLDMHYYDAERTACIEPEDAVHGLIRQRRRPLLWISGHIHLRPDHYLFPPYKLAPQVWQVHCPDSWGYSRWLREHLRPQRHQGLFSRHLEIHQDRVVCITHDHHSRRDVDRHVVEFGTL
jgi:hypothetical protein